MQTKELRLTNIAKALYLLLCLVPVLLGFGYIAVHSDLMSLFDWENSKSVWIRLIAFNNVLSVFLYSFYQAAVGVGLSVIVALLLYYVLSKRRMEEYKIPVVLFNSLTFPPIVAAFVFYNFWINSGELSRLFAAFDWIETPSQFPDIVNGQAGFAIILVHLFLCMPFFTISFLQSSKLLQLKSYRTLTRSMGANDRWSVIWVEVPMLLRHNLPLILLYFIFLFGAYEIPLLIGSDSSPMLTVYIMDRLEDVDLSRQFEAFVLAFLYFLLVFFVFYFFLKKKIKKTR